MGLTSLLIANRGEIAVRILRSASELGLKTVAVFSEDDASSLHTHLADEAVALDGRGPNAYLDREQIIRVARDAGCDAIHPGYGFLSENAAFARRCLEEGITFVGPRAEVLDLFGDKVRAREAASRAGVPVLPGTISSTTLQEAREFYQSLGSGRAMIIKAVNGGGGRGVRVVERLEELDDAYARCRSEAAASFGSDAVYVEELVRDARHIEVQILGDGTGEVAQLGERDCSMQRRQQKIVEIAPPPGLSAEFQERIAAAAVKLARHVRFDNAGTFEFLVHSEHDARGQGAGRFAFIEANPRLQVEHTVTEQVTGIDLVRAQLEIAGGSTLETLGLRQHELAPARGFAIEVRVNMETMTETGEAMPAGGTLTTFDAPSGPGIRVDTFGYAGYSTSPRFDSLLAKVIAHTGAPRFLEAIARCERALGEFRIEGLDTNIPFLLSLLRNEDFRAGRLSTHFVEDRMTELVQAAKSMPRSRHVVVDRAVSAPALAGARLETSDPLAVLAYGKASAPAGPRPTEGSKGSPVARGAAPDGAQPVNTPLQGTVVAIEVREGDIVRAGQTLLVMESMKMEHEIKASTSGIVRRIAVATGDTLYQGHPLLYIEESEVEDAGAVADEAVDLDEIRPDLSEVLERRGTTRDDKRPAAVARRRATGQRTARENIEQLCDPGTFIEYGPLVLAAQRSRRTLEDLIVRSPADGMITGVGRVNGELFEEPASRCAIMSYDYTVFAGTQGQQNHRKTDRMIDVAEHGRMPMILFAEGGGGRPGDTDGGGGGGSRTFSRFAQLSALVPMVGITSGRCFAGNASLLGCCDVIIATAGSNIGMGGPAMIEGGGLGVFTPEEIGPLDVQLPSGVVDIAVADEREAVAVAKQYLSYFQGTLKSWESPDQRLMRRIVPENRLRAYDVHTVIETLADVGTVLELRKDFGVGMVTALIRVEGRPLGVIANSPMHLGGAIDSDGADKGARFMQLCDAFDLPILFFCDTPGIMVGPEIEYTALVRHSSRMFVIGANLSVPFFTVVLRKAYGLGAIAMAGGSYKVPFFSVAWPTGEFGGMGLEGSVKLGFRDDLAAIEDPAERKRVYDEMVARAYERGKALNNASSFGVDDAIDPAETRTWVAGLMASVRPAPRSAGKKRPAIDAW